METTSIARSLLRKWWLFVIILGITVGATYYLTLRQTPVYRARTTYIMRLSDQVIDAKTISTSLDILNRNDELTGTYSEIAMSQMIKRAAGSRLELTGAELRSLSVSSRALPGSKLMEISVEGNHPELVRDFATIIGEETLNYANGLYPAYELNLLDEAAAPARPISPKMSLNLLLGGLLGAFFGMAAVIFASWIRGDFKHADHTPVFESETGELTPVKREAEMLMRQIELMRAELSETRKMIQNTGVDVKSISTLLNSLPKNGNGYGKGR